MKSARLLEQKSPLKSAEKEEQTETRSTEDIQSLKEKASEKKTEVRDA